MATFRLPPISPLAGSSFINFIQNLRCGHIEKKYWFKILLTGLLAGVSTPFRWWEHLYFMNRLNIKTNPLFPVFILGHWRSGTTFLHNLMCQGENIAYVTTYQSLFPDNLSSKWLFKNFMKQHMPEFRPGDNIPLNVNYPQEDEFALCNLMPYSYYRFFYFPGNYNRFYNESIKMDIDYHQYKAWQMAYKKLINKAIFNTNGAVPIIKNPVNTGRIKMLKETFPSARFIHIYRNPVIVYLSTKKFLTQLMPTLWFHQINQSEIIDLIVHTYKNLYQDYFRQIEFIDPEDRMEIKFEEFEKSPMDYLKILYYQFGLDDFNRQKGKFVQYLNSTKNYRKNVYTITRSELNMILKEWEFTFHKWGYNVPNDLKIIER